MHLGSGAQCREMPLHLWLAISQRQRSKSLGWLIFTRQFAGTDAGIHCAHGGDFHRDCKPAGTNPYTIRFNVLRSEEIRQVGGSPRGVRNSCARLIYRRYQQVSDVSSRTPLGLA